MATYKVVHVQWWDSLSKDQDTTKNLSEEKTIQQALDRWAAAGWELVAVSARSEDPTPWHHLLYFRKDS